MLPIVEFCQSNLGAGTQSVKRELEKDPSIDVIDYGCLSYCTMCAKSPYALVNGTIVTGKSTKELLANIYKQIEKEEAEFEQQYDF